MVPASPTPDPRELARRALARALGERGLAGADPSRPGVHVAVDPPRPASAKAPVPSAAPELVTLECLRALPDGASFELPSGARLTPAAEEEAWRRGLRAGGPPASRGPWRVAVGSDHGGFALKAEVLEWLRELGHRPFDLGTRDAQACDYPDFARAVAEAVAGGQAELGICIDGAGIGSAMVANKVPGVLAAPAWSEASARNAREHNHATVLTLGAGLLSRAEAHAILRAFLAARPADGRHARRVEKIHATGRDHARRPQRSQP